MSSESTYWLGIDGGGTRSEWIVADDNENVIENIEGPPLQASSISIAILLDRLKTMLQKFDLSHISGICAGISGLGNPKTIMEMENALRFYVQNLPLIINSDAKITHKGTFEDGDGTLVIAGTGSIVLSRINGNWYRRGGWGHVIGDPGSAHSIGLRFLRYVLLEEKIADYSQFLTAYFDTPKTDLELLEADLLKAIYSDKFSPAILAPNLLIEAENGDSFIKNLILTEVNELADSILYLYQKENNLSQRLALHGGLLNNSFYLDTIQSLIKSRFSDIEFVESPTPPALAACRVIKRHLS